MSRLDARYHALMRSHRTAESVFDNWRDRYVVAGTSQATRSKRRSHQSAQRLRAAAALLAEWFRICLRHGYIGQHARLNAKRPLRPTTPNHARKRPAARQRASRIPSKSDLPLAGRPIARTSASGAPPGGSGANFRH